MRQASDDKYSAATGTTGWRWLEADYIRKHHLEGSIDERYFIGLCDAAKDHINEFGSFERFISDEPMTTPFPPGFPPDVVRGWIEDGKVTEDMTAEYANALRLDEETCKKLDNL